MKNSYSYIVMIVLSLSFLLGGCSQDVSTSSLSQLVVEGWIDAGGFPVVKLTRTIPLSDDALSLDSLSRYMDRWAKVTISDGERTEVLAGRYDKKYFPPFIYTTYDMRGEEGREYSLRVEASDGKVAEARTRIPVSAKMWTVFSSFMLILLIVESVSFLRRWLVSKGKCRQQSWGFLMMG